MPTIDEMIALANKDTKVRRKSTDEEHHIQVACVSWFSYQFPQFRHNLFAVPNGAKRSKRECSIKKSEGMLAGVSDLILLRKNSLYGALLIEMKTDKGKQSDSQKQWQQAIEKDGYRYVVVRSLDEFMKEVKYYLSIV